MPDWATHQIIRASGLIENVCACGCGHPHPASVEEFEKIGIMTMGIHGCCSKMCCADEKNDQ